MPPSDPTFSFAHLSDVHLPPLPRVGLRDLTGKRVLGYVSWHKRRKYEHRAAVLDSLVTDLTRQAPDHVALTGDLTNLGLPAEFDRIDRWLARLGPIGSVTVVPGNHDAYAPASLPAMWRALGRWLRDDTGADGFPLLHVRAGIAFIGVSTAVPTGLGQARGRVGDRQLARLEEILRRTAARGLSRVLLLHHPPQAGADIARRGLDDAPAVRATIASVGAELILHGHTHRSGRAVLAGSSGPVPVYGVASASLRTAEAHGQGHYRLFRPRRGGGFHVEDRFFDPVRGVFAAAGATADHGFPARAAGEGR